LSFFPLAALQSSLSRSCAVCTLPPSLSLRLASEKKSCVSLLSDYEAIFELRGDVGFRLGSLIRGTIFFRLDDRRAAA
jgi:hypothetical protein